MFSGPFSSNNTPGSFQVSGLLNLLYGASPDFRMKTDNVANMMNQSRITPMQPMQQQQQTFAPMIYQDYAPMNYGPPQEASPLMEKFKQFSSQSPLFGGGAGIAGLLGGLMSGSNK